MSGGKLSNLPLSEAVAFRDGTILHAEVEKGFLLCCWDEPGRQGGAFSLSDSAPRTIRAMVRELLALLRLEGKQLRAKLVSVAMDPAPVLAVLKELGIELHGQAHHEGAVEAYFYTDTGRLRVGLKELAKGNTHSDTIIAMATATARKRVLIVDDSKTIRQLLTRILSADPALEVVGAAERPSEAERMIAELKPDVITLDINMPEMDGVTFLKKFLPRHPIPTIMISALSMEEGNQVLTALEIGAVDYIQKPSFEELDRLAPWIVEKVKTASHVKVRKRDSQAGAPMQRLASVAGAMNQNLLVAVGSSTGGTEALRYFFTKLPSEIPPIVVVQHIPPVFSLAFANRLAELCPFEVKEAKDGDAVQPNRVLIAPGGTQMEVVSAGSGHKVRVFDGEPVNRHKPSVDVLFHSVAREFGKRSVGIILTGMGRDGAKGLLEMRQTGARTIAQDEASCVVFGMPKEAIKLGAAEAVHPLGEIPEVLQRWLIRAKT